MTGQPPHVNCTSLPCQVATRRTRTAGKVEIPNVDDHVSKLEHMGKETVKKLQDIKGSAVQSGIDIAVPDNRIDKGARRRGLHPVFGSPLGSLGAAGTTCHTWASLYTFNLHSVSVRCTGFRLCNGT